MIAGIIGMGEVGKAVKDLLQKKHRVLGRDLSFDEITVEKVDSLHICIPYNKSFEKIVVQAIKEIKTDLVIIHSTVKPGTTQAVYKKTKVDIVHTPFMGVHPAKPKGEFIHGEGYCLADYFTSFPKMIGPTTKSSATKAQRLFENVGLKVEIFGSSLESEVGKIVSTTYYGWNIIFEKWVHSMCQKTGADFENVYTKYNTFYNNGYKERLPHVQRPVLKHHEGKIGGHCVIPNAEIIQDWMGDDFTKFLLEQNEKLS